MLTQQNSPYDLDDVPNSLPRLLDFLEEEEHSYFRKELDGLESLLEDAFRSEEGAHVDVLEVLKGELARMSSESRKHMSREERALFPRARRLIAASESTGLADIPLMDVIEPVHHEHENALEWTKRIRRITGDFYIPAGAGESLRELYERFQQFQRRLERHVWIEENLVVPDIQKLQDEIEEKGENV